MAGRCPHPGKRCDGLHLTGRVRSAVCPWTADGGGGQRRKHPVAAPAGGVRPAGEDRRHMARRRHGGLRHGGAYRRPQRYGGGGRRRHDAGGGGPSVRRIGAALRLFGVSAGTAAPRPAAGAGGGALYGGAAVLYGDGGSDTLGGPGLHHADIPAGGSAAAPGERRAYQPVGGAAGDPAGRSLRCSGGEPAAELRCHAGTGVLLPKAERLFQGAVPGKEAAGGVLRGRQSLRFAGGHGVHHPADGLLLQHIFPHSAAEQSAHRSGGGMELHAGLRGDAGGLSLASGGTGAGLGRVGAGAVCPVDGIGSDPSAGPCAVFFQPLSQILAGVCLRPFYRLRHHRGAAAEIRRGGSWRP